MRHYKSQSVLDNLADTSSLELEDFVGAESCCLHAHVCWRRGVVVTELVVSTKLLCVEPG